MGTYQTQTISMEIAIGPFGADTTPGNILSPGHMCLFYYHHYSSPYLYWSNPAFPKHSAVLWDRCLSAFCAPLCWKAAAAWLGGERSSPSGKERRAAASGYGKIAQEPPELSESPLQPLWGALLRVSTVLGFRLLCHLSPKSELLIELLPSSGDIPCCHHSFWQQHK